MINYKFVFLFLYLTGIPSVFALETYTSSPYQGSYCENGNDRWMHKNFEDGGQCHDIQNAEQVCHCEAISKMIELCETYTVNVPGSSLLTNVYASTRFYLYLDGTNNGTCVYKEMAAIQTPGLIPFKDYAFTLPTQTMYTYVNSTGLFGEPWIIPDPDNEDGGFHEEVLISLTGATSVPGFVNYMRVFEWGEGVDSIGISRPYLATELIQNNKELGSLPRYQHLEDWINDLEIKENVVIIDYTPCNQHPNDALYARSIDFYLPHSGSYERMDTTRRRSFVHSYTLDSDYIPNVRWVDETILPADSPMGFEQNISQAGGCLETRIL